MDRQGYSNTGRDAHPVFVWDHTIRIWDPSTGQQVGPTMQHDDGVAGVLLTRDETPVLSWSGNSLRLWNIATGTFVLIYEFYYHGGGGAL